MSQNATAREYSALPAIIDRDRLNFVLPHSGADVSNVAKILTEMGGIKKARQYNMKGMGTVTSFGDLGAFLSLGHTPHFECVAEAIEHDDLNDPSMDLKLDLDILRAFGPQAAQIAPAIAEMVEDARAALAAGDGDALKGLSDLTALVETLAEIKKIERAVGTLDSVFEGKMPEALQSRIETAMASLGDKAGALTIKAMDRGKLPPQIPVMVAARLSTLAARFEIPTIATILRKIETRMQPAQALETSAMDLIAGLHAALKDDGLAPELREQIEATLERLENTDEGKALSFDDTKALRDLVQTITAAGVKALPPATLALLEPLVAKIDILLDANTVFKAAKLGLPVAQMQAIEIMQVQMDALKQTLIEATADTPDGSEPALSPELLEARIEAIDSAIAKLDSNPGSLEAIHEIIALQVAIAGDIAKMPEGIVLQPLQAVAEALAVQAEAIRPVQEQLTAQAMGIEVEQVRAIVGTLEVLETAKASLPAAEASAPDAPATIAERIEAAIEMLKTNPGSLEAIHEIIALQAVIAADIAKAPDGAAPLQAVAEALAVQAEAVRPVQEQLTAQAMGIEVEQVRAIVNTLEVLETAKASLPVVEVSTSDAPATIAERIEAAIETLKNNPASIEAIHEIIALQAAIAADIAKAPEAAAPLQAAAEALAVQAEAVRPVQEQLTAQAMGIEVEQVRAIVNTLEVLETAKASLPVVEVSTSDAPATIAERIEAAIETLKNNPASIEAIHEIIALQAAIAVDIAKMPEAAAPLQAAAEALAVQAEAVRPVQEQLTAQAMGIEVEQVRAIVNTLEVLETAKAALPVAEVSMPDAPATIAERIEAAIETLKSNPASIEAIHEIIALQAAIAVDIAKMPEAAAPLQAAAEALAVQAEAVRPVQEQLTAQAMGIEVEQVRAIVGTLEVLETAKAALPVAEVSAPDAPATIAERIEAAIETLKSNPASIEAIHEIIALQAAIAVDIAKAPEGSAPLQAAAEALAVQADAIRPVQEQLTAQAMGIEVEQVRAIVNTLEVLETAKAALPVAEVSAPDAPATIAERIEAAIETLKSNPASIEAIHEIIALQAVIAADIAKAPEGAAPLQAVAEALAVQAEAVRPVQEQLTAQAMGIEVEQVRAIVNTLEVLETAKASLPVAEARAPDAPASVAERIEAAIDILKTDPKNLDALVALSALSVESVAVNAKDGGVSEGSPLALLAERLQEAAAPVIALQQEAIAQKLDISVNDVQDLVGLINAAKNAVEPAPLAAAPAAAAIDSSKLPAEASPLSASGEKMQAALEVLIADPTNIAALKDLAQARTDIAALVSEAAVPQSVEAAAPVTSAASVASVAADPAQKAEAASPIKTPEPSGLKALDALIEARVQTLATQVDLPAQEIRAALGGDKEAQALITKTAESRTVTSLETLSTALAATSPLLATRIESIVTEIRAQGLEKALAKDPDIAVVLAALSQESPAQAKQNIGAAGVESVDITVLGAVMADPALRAAVADAKTMIDLSAAVAPPPVAAAATENVVAAATPPVAAPDAPAAAGAGEAPAQHAPAPNAPDVMSMATPSAVKNDAAKGEARVEGAAAEAPKAEKAGAEKPVADAPKDDAVKAETVKAGARDESVATDAPKTQDTAGQTATAAESEPVRPANDAVKAEAKARAAEAEVSPAAQPDLKTPDAKGQDTKGQDAKGQDTKTPDAKAQESKTQDAKAAENLAQGNDTPAAQTDTAPAAHAVKEPVNKPSEPQSQHPQAPAQTQKETQEEAPKSASKQEAPKQQDGVKQDGAAQASPRAQEEAPLGSSKQEAPKHQDGAKQDGATQPSARGQGETPQASAKQDVPQQGGVKPEAVHQAGAKQDGVAQDVGAKQESVKRDTMKQDVPQQDGATQTSARAQGETPQASAKQDVPQQGGVKPETGHQAGAKQDGVAQDVGAKQEGVKHDSVKQEVPQQQGGAKQDAVHQGGVKQDEGVKVDAAKKNDAPTQDAPKQDAPKQNDVPKQEAQGQQPSQAQPVQPEQSQPQPQQGSQQEPQPQAQQQPQQEQQKQQDNKPACNGGPDCPHCKADFNKNASGNGQAPNQSFTADAAHNAAQNPAQNPAMSMPTNMNINTQTGTITVTAETPQGVREERVYTREDMTRDTSAQQETTQRLEKDGFIQQNAQEERALEQAMAQQQPQQQQPQQPEQSHVHHHHDGHNHNHGHDHGHSHGQQAQPQTQQEFSLKEEFHKCGPDCWHNASTAAFETQTQSAVSYGSTSQEYAKIDVKDIDFAPMPTQPAPARPEPMQAEPAAHSHSEPHTDSPFRPMNDNGGGGAPTQPTDPIKSAVDEHPCSGLCGTCKKCFVEAASVKEQIDIKTDLEIEKLLKEASAPKKRKLG